MKTKICLLTILICTFASPTKAETQQHSTEERKKMNAPRVKTRGIDKILMV